MNELDALPPWLAEPYNLCKLCVPGQAAAEFVGVEDSLSRVTVAEVAAEHDVPRIDYSQCRGYALRSTDTLGASRAQPIVLAVRGDLELPRVGRASAPKLQPGVAEAICLAAGVPMPQGTDAIKPEAPRYVDDIAPACDDQWNLELTAPVVSGNGVLKAGSDCLQGDVLLTPGERIGPSEQALCAAAGVRRVLVARRPRIGVVVTSHDMLAPGSAACEIWQRPDSTGIFVRSLLRQWGYDVAPVVYLPPIGAKASSGSSPFSREAYISRTRELISSLDLIVGCGMSADPLFSGLGLGDPIGFPFDRTRVDLAEVPASRFSFARSEDRSPPRVSTRTVFRPGAMLPDTIREESHDQAVLVYLPGGTSTVALLMHCVVRRIVDLLEGVANPLPRWEWATLEHAVPSDKNTNRMLWGIARCRPDEPAYVRVTVRPEHDRISSMRDANVIVALAACDVDLVAGDRVRVLRC